jgi:hypothetical protein
MTTPAWMVAGYNKQKVVKKIIKPQVPENDKWGDFRTINL